MSQRVHNRLGVFGKWVPHASIPDMPSQKLQG